MPDLPRPDVTVTNDETTVDVTIARESGKEKKYRGYGGTVEEKVKDVVRKILDDPVTAEVLPSGREF